MLVRFYLYFLDEGTMILQVKEARDQRRVPLDSATIFSVIRRGIDGYRKHGNLEEDVQ